VTTPAGCTTSADVTVSGVQEALVEPTIASSGPACAGEIITLSIGGYTGSSVAYTWNIPPAALAAGNITGQAGNVLTINPLEAAHAGNYSVTVDVDGCSTTSDVYAVQVFATPSLAPSATLGTICTGDDLQLTAGGAGATSWAWSGPSGFTSTAQDPLISGVSPSYNGTYTVTATNVSGCSITTSIDVNNINDIPTQPAVNANGPVCIDENIILSSATAYGGTVTYAWTNANGTALTLAMGGNTALATIAANDALAISPYRLQVTVDGCVAPISEVLHVQVDEIPVATASNNGPICEGSSASLLAGTVDGATYEWRTGGVLVSTDQGYNIPNLSATTTYELTVVRGQCTSVPVQTTVTVTPAPDLSPRFDYTAESDCSLTDLELFAHTGGLSAHAAGYTYSWSGPNGFTSTDQNPILTNATSAANGSYTLTVMEGGSAACAKTATVEVSGVREPLAEPIISATGEGCENGTVTLSVSTYTGSDVTYTWATPAGTTQDISGQGTNVLTINPSDAAVHTGSYAVTIVVDGCTVTSDPYAIDIDATPAVVPTADYTLAGNCSVSDLELEANPVGSALLVADYTYAWSGPNGFTSTEQDPVIANVTPAANGSYLVTVSNLDGCTSTTSVQVNGIQATVAQPVIATSGPACEGESITLSVAVYSGSSVDYIWNTPGATTTNISGFNTNAITISPATGADHNGDYTVTVVVDGCTLNSDLFEIELYDLPTASPSITAGDICFGESIQLSANDINGTSFSWTGPNGFTSTAENPTIANATPANNGTYTLELTSIEGCVNQASVTVNTVREMPTQPVLTSNGPVCEDSDIVLTTSTPVSGTTTYQWRNGAGTALAAFGGTTRTLTIPATDAAAIQPFTLEVSVDGCPALVSEPMNVQVDVVPTAVASNNGPVCSDGDAILTAGFIAGATYEWRVQGQPAIISTDRTVDVFGLTSTTVYELIAVRGECRSAPVTTTVTVNNNPVVSPDALYFVAADCSPSSLTLRANAGGGTAPYSYDWTGPNGFTSNQANPVINPATPANNGSYAVTITDVAGCTANGTVQVNNIVAGQPEPQITASGPTCEGGTVVLTVDEYTGTSVSYTWQTPGGVTQGVSGFSTRQLTVSPANTLTHEGLYTVTINVDGCVLFSDAYRVDVFEQPTVAPLATIPDNCDGGRLEFESRGMTAAGVLTYEWTGPNGFTSTQANPVIDPATQSNNGRYEVTVTNASGCTATQQVDVTGMLPPAHAPTIDAQSICEGEDLVLSTSAGGNNFEWIGPNGASVGTLAMPGMTTGSGSTTLDPSNANYLAGDWSVRVTDANGCVATSDPVSVTISPVPVATPSNNGPLCLGSVATFSVQDVQGATYAWYDDDPILPAANLVSQERTYAEGNLSTGPHTRYVVVTLNGCSSPAAATTVNVTDAPTASPSYSYSVASDCSAEDLQLFSNPLPALGTFTYSWSGPNGFTSTLADPTIASVDESYNGSYSVLITDGGGCSVLETVEVNDLVNAVSEPTILSSGPTCEGGEVTLTTNVLTGSNVAYSWTMPNGTRVSGQGTNTLVINGVDAAIHDGSYSVEITVDGCVLSSDPYVLTTLPSPTTTPGFMIVEACDGGSFSLSANAAGVAPLTYAWTGPNGFNSTLENPVLAQADQTDNGIYTLAVTSANGCTTIETVTVSGMLPPAETPTIDAPSICEGEDLVLTTSTSGIQFEWIGPNGASTSTLAMPGMTTATGSTSLPAGSANYLSGDWSVRVTDANGCVGSSPVIAVSISEVPIATLNNSGPVCDGEDILFSMNSITGAAYAWYNADPNFGGILVSQDRVMTRTNLAVGTHTYFAVLTVGGCSSTPVATTATVNELPIAIPTHNYSLQPDCSPGDLTLQANPRNGAGGYTYIWTGPNGFTSTEANPVLITVDATYNGVRL